MKESKVKPTEEVAPSTLNTNRTKAKEAINVKVLIDKVSKTNKAADSTNNN